MHPGVAADRPRAERRASTHALLDSLRTFVSGLLDVRSLGLGTLVFVAYALTAIASRYTVIEPLNVAAIWFPAGVAVSAFLLSAVRRWPYVIVGIALATIAGNDGVPPTLVAGFIGANCTSPLVTAGVMRRAGFDTLGSVRGVGIFTMSAIVVGPISGAFLGATAATLQSGAPFVQGWVTWAFSEVGGVLTIVPLALVLAAGLDTKLNLRRLPEAALLTIALLALTVAAFGPWLLGLRMAAYPIFLILVLAAVRFGILGAAFSTVVVAATTYFGTIAGYGPIAQLNPGAAVQMGMAHVLVAIAFLTAFVTAAAMAERRAAADALTAHLAIEERRAAISERITAFAREIARSLELDALLQEVARESMTVVPADIVWLTLAVSDDGPHRVATAIGAPDLIGHVVEPGDGVIGSVIRDGATVVRDRVDPSERSPNRRTTLPDRPLATVCAPILIDGRVGGTIGLARLDLSNPFLAAEVRAVELMGSLVAVSLTNSAEFAEVRERSIRDELTGVPNRRYFTASFEQLAAQRVRQPLSSRQVVSAIMFDLDHFGAVNKERGHVTGDRVLAEFGSLLTSRLRKADVVARYGGEEFVVILLGTNRGDAARVADDVRTAFGSTSIVGADGDPIRCTVSAGVASVPAEEPSLDGLLPAADVALAMAKRAGRNMVATA